MDYRFKASWQKEKLKVQKVCSAICRATNHGGSSTKRLRAILYWMAEKMFRWTAPKS